MKNTPTAMCDAPALYPAFRKCIAILLVSVLVVLPLCIGTGYYVYTETQDYKTAFAIPFGILFVYVVGTLLHLMFLKCPHCGKHSLYLSGDPADITSTRFVYRQFYVICRNCDFSQDTDLGMKSNILFKSIPFKVKPEDEE